MTEPLHPRDMARIHAAAFTQSRPWTETEFASLLDSPLSFATGGPHCFALVRVIADEAELLTIATDPMAQRQGLARALMLDWQKLARAHDAKTAFLEVAADNIAALALYQSDGFAPCGQRAGYYSRPNSAKVDAIVMRKPLA